jgi:Galactose binding lectin domain
MGFKSIPYTTKICGTTAENQTLTLTAPNDATYTTTFTDVDFASYGTPTGSCQAFALGSCHSSTSYGVIYNAFIGKTSATVTASNAVFGDPCPGTSKNLYVQLTASGTQKVFVAVPTINTFTANPNPQNSVLGTPLYNTTLTWTTTDGNNGTATITSNAGETWDVSSLGGNLSITNLPQSFAGALSPATRIYTLTVTNEIGESTTRTVTVSTYNDNSPNDFTVPNQINQNPSQTISWSVGPITGIDMNTIVTASTGVDVSLNGSSWSAQVYVNNNQSIFLRTSTLGFNTDPKGLVNNKNCYVDVGPLRKFFSVTTRAPNIEEIFDFPDSALNFPYPDIDQVANTPTPYIVDPLDLGINDVELATPYGTEITSSLPEVQVRIKTSGTSTYGSWLYLREGFIKIPFGNITARTGLVVNPTPTQFNTRNAGIVTSINATA